MTTQFPRFHGDGYMKLHGLPNTAFHQLEVAMEMRPDTSNGIIMVATKGILNNESIQDFFSLSLVDGFLIFRFDCGGGVNELKPTKRLERNRWNVVQIKRINKIGSVIVNDGDEVKTKSKGSYSKVSLGREYFIGGHPNMSLLGGLLGTKHGLVGCIRRLFVDGRKVNMRKGDGYRGDAIDGWNVESCSRDKDVGCHRVSCLNGGTCVYDDVIDDVICWCSLGYVGYSCQTIVTNDIIPNFRGNSYMKFNAPHVNSNSLTFDLKVRAESERGILLYMSSKDEREGDFMMLSMNDGFVQVSFNLGAGTTMLRSKKPLRRSQWHEIKVSRHAKKVLLQVDGESPSAISSAGSYIQLTLTPASDLYVGGHPVPHEMHKDVEEEESFQGCIQQVIIGNRSLNLMDEAIDGRNIEGCVDVCSDGACGDEAVCVEEDGGNFMCI